jgi:hypothetical protein
VITSEFLQAFVQPHQSLVVGPIFIHYHSFIQIFMWWPLCAGHGSMHCSNRQKSQSP